MFAFFFFFGPLSNPEINNSSLSLLMAKAASSREVPLREMGGLETAFAELSPQGKPCGQSSFALSGFTRGTIQLMLKALDKLFKVLWR